MYEGSFKLENNSSTNLITNVIDTNVIDNAIDTNVIDTNVIDNAIDTNAIDTNVIDTNVIDTNVIDNAIDESDNVDYQNYKDFVNNLINDFYTEQIQHFSDPKFHVHMEKYLITLIQNHFGITIFQKNSGRYNGIFSRANQRRD